MMNLLQSLYEKGGQGVGGFSPHEGLRPSNIHPPTLDDFIIYFYFVLIFLYYASYGLFFFQIVDSSHYYIFYNLNIFIQLFIAVFLMIRYHPFKKVYDQRKSDQYIIFASGSFLIINLGIWQIFSNVLWKNKGNTSSLEKFGFEDRSVSLYITDLCGNQVVEPTVADWSESKRYDPNNYDVSYHEEGKDGEFYNSDLRNIQVLDKQGQLTTLPYAPVQNLPVYYNVEENPNGIHRVIPTYRETVMMESKQVD